MKVTYPASVVAFVIVACGIIVIAAFNHPVRNPVGSNYLISNYSGNYLYLPACLLYNDSAHRSFEFLEPWQKMGFSIGGFYAAGQRISDGYVIKDIPGMAILWLPFFLSGHALAWVFDFPGDGFSVPYQVAIFIGGVFYVLAGMWFLRRILVSLLGDPVAAITLIALFLTTGLFWTSCFQSWRPEGMLFFTVSLGIWASLKFDKDHKLYYALLSGMAIGISCLIKPLALILIFVPLLLNILDKSSWKLKISNILIHRWKILAATLCFLMPVVAPFFYWKATTGNYLFDPWGFVDNVKLLGQYLPDLFLSGENGLLAYSPVLVLILPGYYFLSKVKPELFYAFFMPVVLLILLAGSLPPKWYTGGPGRYDLTGFLPLAAVPLGYFFSWIYSTGWYFKAIGAAAIVFLSIVNVSKTFSFTIQAHLPARPFVRSLSDIQGYSSRSICYYGFEDGCEPPQCQSGDFHHTGKKSFKLTAEQQYSQGLTRKFGEIPCRDSSKVRITAYVYFGCAPHNLKVNLVMSCIHNGQGYQYKAIRLTKESVVPNKWNYISYVYWLPADRQPEDFIQVYFWNTGGGNLYIDDFKVDLLTPVANVRKE